MANLTTRNISKQIQERHNKIVIYLNDISNFAAFTYETFKALFNINKGHFGPFLDVIILQTKFTGVWAIKILGFIAITIGGLTIINAYPILKQAGKDALIADIMIFVIVREIGPIITGIIIIIRSGSAIASEIATQKLNKEIDALELHGIDPYLYIVLPRVIGGAIATITLLVYFDIFAFLGGFWVAKLIGIDVSAAQFFTDIMRSIGMKDLLSSMTKGAFFGLMIPLICTYNGFMPSKLYEIPMAVSKAVIRSLVMLFLSGGIISTFFYL